jgi:hypothetical protein
MLQILWNTIAYTGVSRVPDTSEHKHIVLINILALIVSFCAPESAVIFVAGSNPIFALVSAVYSCLLLFTIALNGSGRSHLARMYFTLLSALFLITDSVLVGSQATFTTS